MPDPDTPDPASGIGNPGQMTIYKILRKDEWASLAEEGSTPGSPVDLADGFIHFSTAGQVAETAARHFAGEVGLMLLVCDTAGMGGDLKWEASRGGALFPHLYRELRLSDVVRTQPLPHGHGGQHVLPRRMG